MEFFGSLRKGLKWDVLCSQSFNCEVKIKVTHWPELRNVCRNPPSLSHANVFYAMLKLKLQPTMKLGPPPPFGLRAKRTEDAGTSSEDDGLPRSPPEMSLLHGKLNSGTTTRVSSSNVDKKSVFNDLFYLCVEGRQNKLFGLLYVSLLYLWAIQKSVSQNGKMLSLWVNSYLESLFLLKYKYHPRKCRSGKERMCFRACMVMLGFFKDYRELPGIKKRMKNLYSPLNVLIREFSSSMFF